MCGAASIGCTLPRWATRACRCGMRQCQSGEDGLLLQWAHMSINMASWHALWIDSLHVSLSPLFLQAWNCTSTNVLEHNRAPFPPCRLHIEDILHQAWLVSVQILHVSAYPGIPDWIPMRCDDTNQLCQFCFWLPADWAPWKTSLSAVSMHLAPWCREPALRRAWPWCREPVLRRAIATRMHGGAALVVGSSSSTWLMMNPSIIHACHMRVAGAFSGPQPCWFT